MSGIKSFIMSEDSSMDDSLEWLDEENVGAWDSEEDIMMLAGQLCRICAEASENLIECFGKQGQELQLVDKIHTHLPIMVTEDDILPVSVCISCVEKLEVCHKLVHGCLEADAKLRTILGFDVTNEEQYYTVKSSSPISFVPSETTEQSQESVTIETFKKLSKEEKSVLDDSSNIVPGTGSKHQIKPDSRMLVLKIKNSSTVTRDVQLKRAMKFLKAGGKTHGVSGTNRKFMKKSEKNATSSEDLCTKSLTSPKVNECIEDGSEENDVKVEWINDDAEENKMENNIKYECIYCDGTIVGKKEFVFHQSTIHNNEVFSCDHCELVFELKDDFNEHIKSHEDMKENLVRDENDSSTDAACQLYYGDKRKNEDDSSEPAKKLKFSDTTCSSDSEAIGKVESGEEKLDITVTEENGEEKYWKCKVWQCKGCYHVSTSKEGLRQHVCNKLQQVQCDKEEDLEEKHQISHREEDSQSRQLLVDHQRKSNEEQNFQCAVCGKLYASWLRLVQHTRIHSSQYDCPLCDRTFSAKDTLVLHMRRHKPDNEYTCKVCLKTFTNRTEFMIHRRIHNRQELKDVNKKPVFVKEDGTSSSSLSSSAMMTKTVQPYKCPICYRLFPSKQRLESHVAMHTDGHFPCHICGKVLSKKNTLEYHLRTHTGEKPFTCSMCPGAFQSRVGLLVHERIHTGEKPYPCDTCNMAFRCRATLNQHKVVHSDERPFRCTHCGRGFRRRDTLDTHIRTHTDERPYACRICGRAFRQKGDCSKHERTHAKHAKSVMLISEGNQSVYSCPLCGQMYELKDDLDLHFENEHTPEEKASSIVIINSENVITIPGITTIEEPAAGIMLTPFQ